MLIVLLEIILLIDVVLEHGLEMDIVITDLHLVVILLVIRKKLKMIVHSVIQRLCVQTLANN